MDITDHTIKKIDIDQMSGFAYVASYRDKFYYTNSYNNTLTCCDINGRTRWTFKEDQVLSRPRGVCVWMVMDTYMFLAVT